MDQRARPGVAEQDEIPVRARLLIAIELFEQGIYAAIAAFLVIAAIALLIGTGGLALQLLNPGTITSTVVLLLDQLLLVFMTAELLHTVRVTLRDHALAAEPFLIVGVIAGVRRILILTAKAESIQPGPAFDVFWVELLLLIALVLAMVVALLIWRRAYPVGEPPV
jgi:uncharacterized membrane protein (DUF373 family)